MQSLNDRMAGCTVFSKIDPVKAYHQIPIAEEDIQKTAVSELDFLGHRISADSVAPLQDNVPVILDFPKPTDCKAMQRFLGMINFYRCFFPRVAWTLRPLTAAFSGNPKTLPWTPNMETTFTASKVALVAAIPLAHPLPGAALALATDSSPPCHV
jgi:hypothetical protein